MRELVANIVKRQRLELPSQTSTNLIERDKSLQLQGVLSSPLVKAIIGPRRAGKSTLALQVLNGKSYAYFNFEDEAIPREIMGDDVLSAIAEVYGTVDYILFDEIQNLPRWEQFINRLLRIKQNVIITGSNAHLLSEELASALTGRHIAIELLTLSYSETLKLWKDDSPENLLKYLVHGGFPEIVTASTETKTYLSTLWDSIILKDIAGRKKVRNLIGLRNILQVFLSSICARYTVDSLVRALNYEVSAPSAKKFLSYGHEAYLISELMPFFAKARRRIKADKKAYVIDNGFFTSRQVSIIDDHSRLMENLVFNELRRRGFRPNLDLFYYITKAGFEVDFLIRDAYLNLELIQVSWSLSQQKTREREYKALIAAAKELAVNKLTIITMNEERDEKLESFSIRVVPLAKWCLEG